ncbi:MAG: hypothetical protein RLP15_00865 [Cryomorphaceae bacterium]
MKHSLLSFFLAWSISGYAQRVELSRPAQEMHDRFDEALPEGVLFYEGFENASFPNLPAGWSTFGLASEAFKTGTSGNAPGQSNANGFWKVPLHGIFALTNDDVCNCDKSQDRLRSRSFNLVGLEDIHLQFSAYQDGSAGQVATVEVRSGTLPWTSIYTISAATTWKVHQVTIPNQFLSEGFAFRFRYNDNGLYASGLALDDIYLYEDNLARFSLETFFTIDGILLGSGQLYHSIPLRQARAAQLLFGAQISNDTDFRKNARLAVSVEGPVEFADTTHSWHIKPNESRIIGTDENVQFSPHLSGNYQLNATLLTDSGDADLLDNSYALNFNVVDSIYQRIPIPQANSAGIWLENTGDRYGSVFQLFKGDSLMAVYIRIHPSTQAGARFRVKVFNYDTLTSSSFSSPPVSVATSDIGTSMRIPMNVHLSRGKQLLAIEKEAGVERLVIGADPTIQAADGNALVRKAGQAWKSFSYFPLTSLVFPPIDSTCSGYITHAITDESCVGIEDGEISTEVFDANIPFTFNWSNGAGNVSSIDALAPGFYDLFVIDAQNCIYEKNFEVRAADTIMFDPILVPDSCARLTGAVDLNISGGDRPFSITWNGIPGSEHESSLAKGVYNIQLSDENGCLSATSIDLDGSDEIGVIFLVTDANCLDANGSIGVTPFGTPPFSYIWSNGDSTQAMDSLYSGIYSITLTDSLGCTTQAKAAVNDANAPTTSVQSISHILCYGSDDGSIDLVTGGGNPPYQYEWSNGDSTDNLSQLSPGEYLLTVTDTSGCKSFRIVEIQNQAIPLLVDFNARGNYCYGDSAGIVETIINGGATPYSMLWSNGSTSMQLTSVRSGTHSFTLTDANSCIVEDSIHVSEGTFFAIQVDSVFRDTNQNFVDENSVFIHALGGVPPIEFLWNDSILTKDLNNVPLGQYTLVATDQLGCSVQLEYLLENGPIGEHDRPDESAILVYPNPLGIDRILNYEIPSPATHICVRSPRGEVVYERSLPHALKGSVQFGPIPSGIYFIELSGSNALFTQRICVLR